MYPDIFGKPIDFKNRGYKFSKEIPIGEGFERLNGTLRFRANLHPFLHSTVRSNAYIGTNSDRGNGALRPASESTSATTHIVP